MTLLFKAIRKLVNTYGMDFPIPDFAEIKLFKKLKIYKPEFENHFTYKILIICADLNSTSLRLHFPPSYTRKHFADSEIYQIYDSLLGGGPPPGVMC